MKVYIDTEAITEGIESIANTIRNLEDAIAYMQEQTRKASLDFTSINFTRASTEIKSATDALDVMDQQLAVTKVYLNKLTEHIERYSTLRY